MDNKPGLIVFLAFLILIDTLCILGFLYRDKILELQKKHLLVRTDFFSKNMLKKLENRSKKENTFLIAIVCIIIISASVASFLKFIN